MEEGKTDKSEEECVTESDSDVTESEDNDEEEERQNGREDSDAEAGEDEDEEEKNKCKQEPVDRTLLTTCQETKRMTDSIVTDEALERILSDDPTLLRFSEALSANTHVSVFSLSNTRADDRVAFTIAKMLRENYSITNLNIESNVVSGCGILALLALLQQNGTLVELRFHNQRHICRGQVEMEIGQHPPQAGLPGPRMTVTSILTRNQDRQREMRLQQQREQGNPEATVQPRDDAAPTGLSERNTPTRKIAEMIKQHEGSTKCQSGQKKPKFKRGKNGANENESSDILKEL
ncbi:unnamed protein product [Coregonus sp. 'balchen']|nr:unnamed protein product [Coregonus sp. 'balchen']